MITPIPNRIWWPIWFVAILIMLYGAYQPGFFNHVILIGVGINLGLALAWFLPPAGRSYYYD